MKNFYLALSALAAVCLASCSTVNYTHDAEDDVYFSSRTTEDIDVVFTPGQDGEEYGSNQNYPINRNPNPGVRTNRRSNDPNYCPPGGTNRNRSIRTTPSSRPSTTNGGSSRPSPTRGNRGSGRTTTPQ
ncbi:MAG: hypothetical protein KTR13_10210 [Saprospiraceae bacterium]|nr:hypothetical protein [Saprospiraceae bacterium]